MSSFYYGKDDVCKWVRENFPVSATVLDVGACDGNWRDRLPEYKSIDAVEVFKPNAVKLIEAGKYRYTFQADIRDFQYNWYDLIIFGDVIEHMSVPDAQAVLSYAYTRCKDMIVAVPFLLKQGAIYDNPYEVHVQDDLTRELFDQRYQGFEVLVDPGACWNYMYYHKGAR